MKKLQTSNAQRSTPNFEDESSALNVERSKKLAWPRSLPDQACRGEGFRSRIRLLRDLLSSSPAPVTAATLAKSLSKARVDKVEELLQTLVMMGQARDLGDGRYGV